MKFLKSEEYIPFSPPSIGREEEALVLDALRSGWITTGPKTAEFEKRIAEYVGVSHSVATFSCTDAMHIALKALGIGPGDEVVTSTFTFASSAHVIAYCGATPVLADVDPETFNVTAETLAAKLTKRTKAVLPVHYAGHPCDMDPILELAREHGLHVVEDAAHALGASYKGRKVGTIGDVTAYSFYATKNLTTAEGGMAVTENEELAACMRRLTMYGISDSREIWNKRYRKAGSIHYDVAELGSKCNMTDINAALGLAQLGKFGKTQETRKGFYSLYDEYFDGNDLFVTPTVKEYAGHAWHLYPLQLNLEALTMDRDTFVDELKALNVGTSVLFTPLHQMSLYGSRPEISYEDYPVANDLFERVLCLPLSPALGEERIRKAAETVLHLADRCRR